MTFITVFGRYLCWVWSLVTLRFMKILCCFLHICDCGGWLNLHNKGAGTSRYSWSNLTLKNKTKTESVTVMLLTCWKLAWISEAGQQGRVATRGAQPPDHTGHAASSRGQPFLVVVTGCWWNSSSTAFISLHPVNFALVVYRLTDAMQQRLCRIKRH